MKEQAREAVEKLEKAQKLVRESKVLVTGFENRALTKMSRKLAGIYDELNGAYIELREATKDW